MLTILLVWIVQFAVLASAGYLSSLLLQTVFKASYRFQLLHFLILGICMLSMVLSIVSIVTNISVWVFLLIAIPLVAVFFLKFKIITADIKPVFESFKSQKPIYQGIVLTFILFCLIYAVGEVRIFDTGLYHAQSIRWINEYGVVPGLGNLHSRFAFNSHFFIIQAFFGFSFLSGENITIYGLNSFFFLVTGLSLLKHFLESEARRDALFYFFILLLASVVVLPRIQSPSPDTISFLLIIHILVSFYKLKFTYQPQSALIYVYVFIIIGFLVTVKLSNLPMLLLALVAYRSLNFTQIVRYALVFLLFIVPLFVRNYYLSGYLIYPFPGLDFFNPEWKIAKQLCLQEIDSIKAWAIAPEADPTMVVNLPFTEKISLWFSKLDAFSKLILAVNLFMPVMIIKKIQLRQSHQAVFWTAVLVNLLYWFVNAPDPRFAFGMLTFCFAYLLSQFPFIPDSDLVKAWIRPLAALILFFSMLAYTVFKFDYMQHAITQNMIRPEPLKIVNYATENGINVTAEADGRCYNIKLPCACSKNAEIIFRSENIADGFKIKK